MRDRIRPLALGGAGALADEAARAAEQRREDPHEADDRLEGHVMGPKRLGRARRVRSRERSRALDLLGFDAQLVFSTFAATQFASEDDLELLYGATRAHNRIHRLTISERQ